MKVKEVECKSIISDSGLYGVDYSINPYTGCEHGCKYCYATFMKKYSKHPEPWGEFVDVKTNARSVLEKDLTKKKKGSILMSSVTDPYQPLEDEYELTKKILKRLADTEFSVTILTKSDLVLRDLNILKEFNPNRISVGFTINFLNERDRTIWEPRSSKISQRIKALRKISESGIESYVHVGPYFEGITNMKGLLVEIEEYATELQVESINFRANKKRIMKTVRENYPGLKQVYEKIRKNPTPFNTKLKKRIRKLEKNSNLVISLFLD